jgi:RHS repeat-associated protein
VCAELQLLAETALSSSPTPNIAYEYLWFAGQPIAQIETATNTVHYYFNDHLGAPILTTNATATVDWRVEREPYGQTFAIRTGADRHQPLSFPGQEEDGEGERSYNIFRWYRAGWGRYTSVDRFGWDSVAGSPAVRERWPDYLLSPEMGVPYSYALNSPLTRTDPRGESAAAALPLAGVCALVDGPLPFGDILAVAILAGAAVAAISNVNSKKCDECEEKKKKGRWTCIATCNVVPFAPKPGITYPERVQGTGYGNDRGTACQAAIAVTQGMSPIGSYTRHCHCKNKTVGGNDERNSAREASAACRHNRGAFAECVAERDP